LSKHLTSTETGKVQNNLLFSAFVLDRTKSEQAIGQILTNMATEKVEAELNQALANAIYAKAEAKIKENSIGAKAPFNSKQQATTTPQAVDALNQWREYKGQNF